MSVTEGLFYQVLSIGYTLYGHGIISAYKTLIVKKKIRILSDT